MRLIHSVVIAAISLAGTVTADDRLSVGIGVGSPYSGLGLNLSLVNEREFKFMSVGCMARYEGNDGESGNACGVGIGWLRSDWFSDAPSKHALGAYIGPVTGERPNANDIDVVYGVGAIYSYFISGSGRPGVQLGISPAIGRANGETEGVLLWHLGYQF